MKTVARYEFIEGKTLASVNMSDYVKHVKGPLQHTAILTALKIKIFRSSPSDEHRIYITQTRPCNIQQYFRAVKMFIFR